MKLVLYHENRILGVFENIRSPSVQEKGVTWEGGSLSDASSFLLLDDDDVEVGSTFTDNLLLLDKKSEYVKTPNDDLTARLDAAEKENEMNALAIMELAELVLGGGV
jgi:hypothetical protein